MEKEFSLEQKLDSCKRVYAEVNLDAINTNAEALRENISPQSKMMAVIKTDGYGHGSVPIAKVLEAKDYVFGYAVATWEEAHVLRSKGISKPILILGYTFPYTYEHLVQEDIRPAVFRADSIPMLAAAAQKAEKPIKVHIKVDTGMNRIGIKPDDDGIAFVKELMGQDGIEIEGIFTHFARADEADKTYAKEQLRTFCEFIHRIEQELSLQIPIKHCSNSAAMMEMPEANMDLVRAGIALYGLYPSEEVSRDSVKLTPALSLHSHIVYQKDIHPGEAVSYGGTFVAEKEMKVATIPVGYGDGYPRGLSGVGQVLIRGRRAPVLGRVCMDQFMVDVTDIPEAREGDPVVLLGCDGTENISAEELGDLSGRFNYELVCDFGKRIPRVYTLGGEVVDCQIFV